MNRKHMAGLALLSTLAFGSAAQAMTVTELSGSLVSFDVTIDAGTLMITINEVWGPGTAGNVRLLFTDFAAGEDWIVKKTVTNNTGSAWSSFGHELLLADGSPSNDFDGLSFAQGTAIPRESDSFDDLFVDELGSRDYLNWFTGSIDSGDSGFFTYGVTSGGNNPFILSQTANIPEPATWGMMIAGFGMVGFAMRRKALAAA